MNENKKSKKLKLEITVLRTLTAADGADVKGGIKISDSGDTITVPTIPCG